jgi:hypothetical protein
MRQATPLLSGFPPSSAFPTRNSGSSPRRWPVSSKASRPRPGLNVAKGQVLVRMSSPQALELQRDRIQADAQATLARQSPQSRDEQLFGEGLIAESRLQASRANAAQSAAQAAERPRSWPSPSTAAGRP